MRYDKIGRSVFVSLLVVLSASFVPRLPMVLMTSGVLAQTVDARKAEADRLLQQGKKLYEKDEYQTAIKYFQKALNIYQEIKNVFGERETLINIGKVYTVVDNCNKTSKYYQQYLAITPKPNISSAPRFREKDWVNYWFIDKYLKELQNNLDKIDMPEEEKRNIINTYKQIYGDKLDNSKIITERIKAKMYLEKANKLHQNKKLNAAIKPYQEALIT